jgi:hypothetical protein
MRVLRRQDQTMPFHRPWVSPARPQFVLHGALLLPRLGLH